MAELNHIGQQCQACQKLDFLPITCTFCQQIFCKDHAAAVLHQCTPEVEVKKEKLKCPKGGDAEDLIKCTCCQKSVSILESIVCTDCCYRFCLQHRHKVDHNCVQQSVSAKDSIEATTRKALAADVCQKLLSTTGPQSTGVTLKARGTKNEALAQRVAAMKLKSIASGQQSIPLEERLYFYITFQPSECCFAQQDKAFTLKAIYLCNQWSVGKCVDWLASYFSLINHNNQQNEPKLVLTTGEIIQQKTPVTYCCERQNNYFCFSHNLKELESVQAISNTATLLLTYIRLL